MENNQALSSEIQRLAESHVSVSQQTFGINFDYSEPTLRQIDEVISKYHPDGYALETTVLGYGAYVGETIRRNLGGVWDQDDRGVAWLKRVGGLDLQASPFSWVQKRFTNGMEDSIAYKYDFLKHQAGGGTATEPTGGLRIAAPAAATPEEKEFLARSPLLVFLLVAAADGKVDKKELAAFDKIVEASLGSTNDLVRQTITQMLPEVERHLEELTSEGVNPLEELKRVAAILDSNHPNEAEEFKIYLLVVATKIAQSSGGFLGFGKKIDDREAAAIAAIAVTLGIKDLACED